MTTQADTAAPARIRWGRTLLGGLFIELALFVVSGVFYGLGRIEELPNVVLPATAVAALLAGMWVARGVERPVLHGALAGLAAILLYLVIAAVAALAAPEQADFSMALSPTYLVSHALKVLGAMIGGLLAARRRG
jgi:hypothetical protein